MDRDDEGVLRVERLVAGLLSDDGRFSEQTLDDIRDFLADGCDEELSREMSIVFLSAFRSGRTDGAGVDGARSPMVERMWPWIADTLGMNPDLEYYR